MKTLAQANKLAKKKKLTEADSLYNQVLKVYPEHPGVRYNQARAYLLASQGGQGVDHLKAALKACPNYEPAQIMAHRLANA